MAKETKRRILSESPTFEYDGVDVNGFIDNNDEDKETILNRRADLERAKMQAEKARQIAADRGDDKGVKAMDDLIAEISDWLGTAPTGAKRKSDGSSRHHAGDDNDGDSNSGQNDANDKGKGEKNNSEKSDSANDDDGQDSDKDGDSDGKNGDKDGKDDQDSDKDGKDGGSDGKDGESEKDKGAGRDSLVGQNGRGSTGGGNSKGAASLGQGNGSGKNGDKRNDDKNDDGDKDKPGEGDLPGGGGGGGGLPGKGGGGLPGKGGGGGGLPNDEDEDEEGDPGDPTGDGSDVIKGMPSTPKFDKNKILIDPFSKRFGNDKLPDDIQKAVEQGKINIEGEWEAFQRIVSKLQGPAREAAKRAMKDYMKETYGITLTESARISMTEATHKAVEDMTDEEFFDGYNDIMDRIDRVAKVDYSVNVKGRINSIKSDKDNVAKNRELDAEDREFIKNARAQAKANDSGADLFDFDLSGLKGMEAFKKMLYQAISDQVQKALEDDETYSMLNKHEDEDPAIIRRGVWKDEKNVDIPSLDVYMDCSGSFSEQDIDNSLAAIAVLTEFERDKVLKLNRYYFANNVYPDYASARAEGGTDAWFKILQNIAANKTKNVVLLTDMDMADDAEAGPRLLLDGCVWFIWKKSRAQSIVDKLRGKGGYAEFDLLRA